MISELRDYIDKKGWRTTSLQSDRELRLDDPCPFCGKKKHLCFDASNGLWKCQRCGESGNLLTLKRKLGDEESSVLPSHLIYLGPRDKVTIPDKRPNPGLDQKLKRNLYRNPDVITYLTQVRCFSTEILDHFNVGYADKGGRRVVSYPFYVDGELVNIKFRTIPPQEKAFRRIDGCPSTLYNQDSLVALPSLPVEDRKVYVLESESDCMAMVQLGYPISIASSAGAGSWQEHWLHPLEDASEIFLVYDNDEAGEAGAERAANMLGRYRCKRVLPALHDVATMLEAGMTHDELATCVDNARPYEDEKVKPTSAYAAQLKAKIESPEPKGRPTGWSSLDRLWGGIRDGELTVVTGDTGSGKSTWTTAFALHRLLAGEPVLIAPFEMRPPDVVGKLVSMVSGKSVFDLPSPDFDHYAEEVCKLPLYWFDCYGSCPLDQIKEAIYSSVRRRGVRFVVLDHLHFFLEVDKPQDERFRIDEAVRALKSWSLDLGIHIVVVVHPHQLGQDRNGKTRKPDLGNLKGSSEIKKTADNGIRIHRKRNENRTGRAEAKLTILKCRSPAGTEGSIPFLFDRDSETYTEKNISGGAGSGPYLGEPDEPKENNWDQPY